jgi:hypothetical protein
MSQSDAEWARLVLANYRGNRIFLVDHLETIGKVSEQPLRASGTSSRKQLLRMDIEYLAPTPPRRVCDHAAAAAAAVEERTV